MHPSRVNVTVPDGEKLARFERAILPHLGAAYNLARWLTGRNHDAEDVAGHMRSLLTERPLVEVASADTHTVKPWFQGHIDFALPVHDLAGQGYPLRGGRVEFLDNKKVAVLVFQRRKHVIDVFAWPQASGATPVLEQTYPGYQVLHWVHGGFTYWAISDTSADGMRRFAGLLMH